MPASTARKTCKMCRMEIPAEARKCPYCHHLQSRLSMLLLHPASILLLLCAWGGFWLAHFAKFFDKGESYEKIKDRMTIVDSRVVFGDSKNGPTVAVLGTIKNTSPITWTGVLLQTDFTDANGTQSDVAQRTEYGLYVPANSTVPFKVSFPREFPEANYIKHAVKVVTAQDAGAQR